MSLTRAGVVHAVQSAAPKRFSDTQEITEHKRRLNTQDKKSSVVKCLWNYCATPTALEANGGCM